MKNIKWRSRLTALLLSAMLLIGCVPFVSAEESGFVSENLLETKVDLENSAGMYVYKQSRTYEDKLVDIVCMLTYSLVPFIITQLAGIVFSNVLTLDEGAFLAAVEILGIVWSGVLIFTGFMTIHQFSFGKTVLSIIMTVIGIAIIIFLAVLFVGLLQQVISFFKSVWSEAVMMG